MRVPRMQRKHYIIMFVVVVAVVVGILALTAQKRPLPGYDGSEDEITTAPLESLPEVDTFLYEDSELGYSVKVPADWQQVTKDGYTTFIHSPSSSSLQVQVKDYDPNVTMMNETEISSELVSKQCLLMNFYWSDNSGYVCMYQSQQKNPVDYIEIVQFDRDTIITTLYTFYDENYEKLEKALTASMDSIQWEKPNPIPTELFMQYSSAGTFEFGVPTGWDTGLTDGAFYANDPVSGASYTLTAAPSTVSYKDVTQVDYVALASNGRSNFMLQSFNTDGKVISAKATYMVNGVSMMLRQSLIATGSYEYSITEECPADTYESVSQTLDDIIKVFRIFHDEEAETATVPADTGSITENETQVAESTNATTAGNAPTEMPAEPEIP